MIQITDLENGPRAPRPTDARARGGLARGRVPLIRLRVSFAGHPHPSARRGGPGDPRDVDADAGLVCSTHYHVENAYCEPGDAVEQLRCFADRGTSHVNVRFADFPRLDGAMRFVEEVVSLLRSAGL